MTATDTGSDERTGEHLSLRFLLLLGLPALGTTFAITMVSSYAPVLLGTGSTPLVVGAVVGSEGLFAILLPLLVGGRLARAGSVAGRVRPLLFTAPLAAAGLVGLGVLNTTVVAVGLGAAVYFASHFVYLVAYQALYADVVPDEQSGRSRSAESVWRLVGAGGALIAGGFMIEAAKPLPFIIAAALLVAVTLVLWRAIRPLGAQEVGEGGGNDLTALGSVAAMRGLLQNRPMRLLAIANMLWNFTLSGLRAFVVLYFVAGLGRSPSFVSGVIFPIVAVGLAIAAPLAGKLADRFGHARVLLVAVPLYGGGLLLPGFTHATWVVVLVPIVSASAATVMTIPYALLMTIMPDDEHSEASAMFTLSRGVGGLFGPLVAGAAVEALSGVFTDTHGYAAVWLVIGAATLATLPLLRRLERAF